MQHINLLDLRLLPKPQRLPAPWLFGVIAVALLGMVGRYAHESAALRKVLSSAAVPDAEVVTETETNGSSTSTESAKLQRRIAALEALRSASMSQLHLPKAIGPTLDAIVASLPDSTWLTEIDIGAGSSLRITGGTVNVQALVALSQRLAQVATLKGTPIGVVHVAPWTSAGGEGATLAAAAHRFVIASAGHTTTEEKP